MLDKLVQVAVLGAAYKRIEDLLCSASTIRRRDEWIDAGIFETLERACLEDSRPGSRAVASELMCSEV